MISKRLLCLLQPARRAAEPLIRGLGVDQNRAWKQYYSGQIPRPGLAYRCLRTPGTARSVHINRAHVARRRRTQNSQKKTAEIVTLIKLVLESDTAGNPITGLKWPRRTTDKISLALVDFGVIVSPNTAGISLLADQGSVTGGSNGSRRRA